MGLQVRLLSVTAAKMQKEWHLGEQPGAVGHECGVDDVMRGVVIDVEPVPEARVRIRRQHTALGPTAQRGNFSYMYAPAMKALLEPANFREQIY